MCHVLDGIFPSLTLKCVQGKPNGLKLVISSLLRVVMSFCQCQQVSIKLWTVFEVYKQLKVEVVSS